MFQATYLKKWTDNFTSVEIGEIAILQWQKGLAGIDNQSIERGVDYCALNLEWPPSIAEFISICEKQNGMPSWEEVIQLAIRRDFAHPIVKAVYDKVGSWNFSNNTERDLRDKVKVAYGDCVRASRMKLLEAPA